MRFKDNSHSKDEVDHSQRTEEIVEALVDDEEVLVDGFQRVSIFGLEVMTLDGPVRMRTVEESEGRRTDDWGA